MTSSSLLQLQRKLDIKIAHACNVFNLIAPDDHFLVCLSGGKDSFTLLDRILDLQRKLPFHFRITAFHLNQKQPGYPDGVMHNYLSQLAEKHQIDFLITDADTYTKVQEVIPADKTPCSLCSRLRRGIIYTTAEKHQCNKIALGHHRDDSVETLLLNMFYAGQIQGMPAKFNTDDGRFTVVRPLIFVPEDLIAQYAAAANFPIIPCNLCGSIDGKRKFVKHLLDDLESSIPEIRNSLLASMTNVRKTHLLDKRLLDFYDDEDFLSTNDE